MPKARKKVETFPFPLWDAPGVGYIPIISQRNKNDEHKLFQSCELFWKDAGASTGYIDKIMELRRTTNAALQDIHENALRNMEAVKYEVEKMNPPQLAVFPKTPKTTKKTIRKQKTKKSFRNSQAIVRRSQRGRKSALITNLLHELGAENSPCEGKKKPKSADVCISQERSESVHFQPTKYVEEMEMPEVTDNHASEVTETPKRPQTMSDHSCHPPNIAETPEILVTVPSPAKQNNDRSAMNVANFVSSQKGTDSLQAMPEITAEERTEKRLSLILHRLSDDVIQNLGNGQQFAASSSRFPGDKNGSAYQDGDVLKLILTDSENGFESWDEMENTNEEKKKISRKRKADPPSSTGSKVLEGLAARRRSTRKSLHLKTLISATCTKQAKLQEKQAAIKSGLDEHQENPDAEMESDQSRPKPRIAKPVIKPKPKSKKKSFLSTSKKPVTRSRKISSTNTTPLFARCHSRLLSPWRTPTSNINKTVKSFILRNTPEPQKREADLEAKKKLLEEKRRREEERQRKIEEERKEKLAQAKRKREERAQRADQIRKMREQAEKERQDQKQEQWEQRIAYADQTKQQQKIEKTIKMSKQILRIEKAEARRKEEEEEKMRRLKEMEEERERRLKEQQEQKLKEKRFEEEKKRAEEERLKEAKIFELQRIAMQEEEKARKKLEQEKKRNEEQEEKRRKQLEKRQKLKEEREKERLKRQDSKSKKQEEIRLAVEEEEEKRKVEQQMREVQEREAKIKEDDLRRKEAEERKKVQELEVRKLEAAKKREEMRKRIEENRRLQEEKAKQDREKAREREREYQKKLQEAAERIEKLTSQTPSVPRPENNQAVVNKSFHNTTFSKHDTTDNYAMTPRGPDRTFLPSTTTDYNIDDIQSGDSTDDEERPRKVVPQWAKGASLQSAIVKQHISPPSIDEIFPDLLNPVSLVKMFKQPKKRYFHRTSSAQWNSPIMPPGHISFTAQCKGF